jgi:hypothetical protein
MKKNHKAVKQAKKAGREAKEAAKKLTDKAQSVLTETTNSFIPNPSHAIGILIAPDR